MIKLGSGHYLSPVGARRTTAAATLVETVYADGMRLPRHSHEFPYLLLMVDGGLRERTRGRTHDLTGGSLVFNDAGEVHENEVLSGNTRCLNVELRESFMNNLEAEGLRPGESVLYTHAGAAMGAVGRLYAATIDPGSEDEVEEAIVELFAAMRQTAARHHSYAWLKPVLELIQESQPDRPTLKTLAAAAGVQQVHLCRGFKAAMACTIGEYVRRLRAGRALGAITRGSSRLADAAMQSGFADQSHMTRTFAVEYGRSPGQLRRAAAGRIVRSRSA